MNKVINHSDFLSNEFADEVSVKLDSIRRSENDLLKYVKTKYLNQLVMVKSCEPSKKGSDRNRIAVISDVYFSKCSTPNNDILLFYLKFLRRGSKIEFLDNYPSWRSQSYFLSDIIKFYGDFNEQ